jgi:hypothetical protein
MHVHREPCGDRRMHPQVCADDAIQSLKIRHEDPPRSDRPNSNLNDEFRGSRFQELHAVSFQVIAYVA